jgi:hypothetical protein
MVTGRIRDIGQNVLWSSFQTGSSSSPSFCTFSSLSHSSRRPLLEIRIMITLCITYIIILCITYIIILVLCIDDNNNAVINNNYGRLQDLLLFFKISMGT